MLTREQHLIMAEFIADYNGGDVGDYLDEATGTRDDFDQFDGRHWREASGRTWEEVAGFKAVHYDSVQGDTGQQRTSLWVVDFGDVRGIFQM